MTGVDDATDNRCARCDMRAPEGQRLCRACRRAEHSGDAQDVLQELSDSPRPAPTQPGAKSGITGRGLGCIIIVCVVSLAVLFAAMERPSGPSRSAPEQTAAPAPIAEPQALPDPADSIRAAAQAQFSTLKADQRAAAVRACVVGSACPQAQVDGIIAAGAHEREREELRRLSHAWGAHVAARRGMDGEQISAVAVEAAALQLEECGISDLKKLDWTTQGEADKDIDGARGKMINVYGQVVQIRKDGDLHWGTMSTGAGSIYFYVVGGTKGVVAGRYAEIAGVVVQRYFYSNTLGGQTESILIVGRVRGQADSDRPLPPAPPASAGKASAPANPPRSPSISRPSSTWDLPLAPSSPVASARPTAAAPSAPPPERWSGALDDRPPPPPKAPVQPEAAMAPSGPAPDTPEH
jgi:hypothetical protein